MKLFVSIAAAVTLSTAVAVPTATAVPTDSRQPSSPSSPSSPPKAPQANCTAAAVPPPAANEGEGDQMPPLDVPDSPLGGERMGECSGVLPPNAPLPPDKLTAASWVIADQDTGAVLAAYAPHARHRPAGTIKVLLALLALRELNPDTIVVGTKDDAAQRGGTRVGLVADGKYITRDLIRALIVTAGPDAANALTRELGGVEVTAKKMNDLARELKAFDTRVVNPNGLDAPGMTTSAFDTAVIYREAMTMPEFAEATGAKTVVITPQGNRKQKITRPNDNKLLDTFKGATGGKAGFTDAAKSTYVGSADRAGKRVLVTIMRSDKTPFEQAGSLLEYGFSLSAARTQPVGELGASAKPTNASRETSLKDKSKDDNAQSLGALRRSAFGNFGLPITILAGVVVLLGLLLTLRRKMQRARRLRAQTR
jgi:D-alanyl-D-alanine carboxypeptidase (penicillin-binding protein 5/6)